MAAALPHLKSGMEQLEDQYSALPDGPTKEKLKKIIDEAKRLDDEWEALYSTPVIPRTPTNKNKYRIEVLKAMGFPGIETEDIENLDAAISAYETGGLDWYQKGDKDYAFFWGGVLKRGWGPLNETMEWGPPKWQKEKPKGRLFV